LIAKAVDLAALLVAQFAERVNVLAHSYAVLAATFAIPVVGGKFI